MGKKTLTSSYHMRIVMPPISSSVTYVNTPIPTCLPNVHTHSFTVFEVMPTSASRLPDDDQQILAKTQFVKGSNRLLDILVKVACRLGEGFVDTSEPCPSITCVIWGVVGPTICYPPTFSRVDTRWSRRSSSKI